MKTPVLFVTFARPDYARQTFNAIKKAKPEKLYFYSNKARKDSSVEIQRNEQIRGFINEIDWNCDLKTYFRDEYVDIYTSLWGAFDWVFENEEQAIILEEDCVPSIAFFDFCDQLLLKFKNDRRIWVISGNNFLEGYNPNNYDYFFSYFTFMYGWASWRDRWKNIIRGELPYEQIKEYRLYEQLYANKKAAKITLNFVRKIVNTPAWDHRFQVTIRCNGGFGIIPKINLVSNIGLFGEHNVGKESIFHNRSLVVLNKYEIVNHPPFVVPDFNYNKKWYKAYLFKRRNLIYRFVNKLSSRIRKCHHNFREQLEF